MPRAHFALCLLGCIALSGVAHAVYEDCKTPPPVDHARAELYEDGDINTALYSCSRGYVIEGPTELICNVTTEEWQGDPPYCSPIFHDDEYYDEYETIDEKDLENDSAEGEDPVAPPPPPPPVEKAEQEQLEELEAIDEDEEDEEDEETSLTPQRQPQPLAEAETIAESTAPVQAPAGLEPTIVVHVDEPQPEEAVQPEPELQAEPKAEVHPVAGGAAPVTDINIVVEPTEDPFTPRLLDENCGEDRGGCAHKCERLLFPGENEPRLKCSCNEGYTLDPQDYATCHDIDECLESNGGCAEICNNLPGTHECACRKGYQIKESDGSCEDIDECAQPEVQAECNNACENTPGSYRCVIPLDTKQEAVEEPEEPEQGKPVEEPTDVEEPAVQKPSCNAGFVLSQDGKECQDINECEIVVEDNENADHVPHRICQQLCENTIGSYRCSCREGFHLQEDGSSCVRDGCDDLDNPQLSRRRCAHECEDLPSGGYACRCPDGYRLAEDLHSCEVLETVCSREQGHERCRPGSCVANEANGTFSCLCPPGYASDVYSCQDLDECALGTHKCSHDCFNTAGGYQCLCPRGMSLQEPEGHTCVAPDPCAFNNNGCEQLCLSADGGACTCSKGYVLSADQKSCQDVDECAVNNGNCQQLCRNLPGAYECVCAAGYEPLQAEGLVGYCFDIDECASNTHSCASSMRCENLNGSYTCLCEPGYALGIAAQSSLTTTSASSSASIALPACLDIDECSMSNANCSHFCINLPGSFQCACPLGFSLAADGRSCQDDDECQLENGQCSQLCLNQPGGFACACQPGFQLAPDGFACLDIDECAVDFGNCSSICINLLGGHACACERGYELQPDGQTCQDVDECAGLLSGGCTHECINKPGSYECGCPLGYLLQEDERSCRPAPVGCPPGSRQTDQGCQPIECAVGLLLGADGSCVDIDECRLNNGGCSHTCRNTQGSYQCACPAGYQLAANARDCQDVDECARANGGCEGSCINEPGSFRCECEPGKRLSFDERSCYAVPAIEPRVAPFPLAPRAPVAPAAPAAPPAPPVMPVRPLPTLRPVTFLEPTVTPAVASAPLPPLPTLPIQPAQPLPSFQVRDQCQRFQAPANGQAHCNRYRHKRKLFYNTRCKVRCNPGYQLIGSEIRSCGASGNWEGQENKCVPVSQPRLWPSIATSRAQSACPALPTPRNGVISPASCTLGPSSFGSICLLRCNMGYVQVGPMSTTCFNGWSLGPLECKPLDSNFFGNQLSTQMQSPWQQQAFNLPQQPAFRPPQAIQRLPARPYIRCPENVVILLGPLQSRAHVILQRPATNVDYRHVVAFPAWAKQLEAHLPAGTHKIVYRAHDPATALSVACQTIITIKRASTPNALPSQFPSFRPAAMSAYRPAPSPQFSSGSLPARPYAHLTDARSESLIAQPPAEPIPVTSSATRSAESTRIDLGSSSSRFCPPSFEVYLKENQNLRSVVWEEPRFEGKLLKIYKSSFPGALFGRGDHDIRYEATTTDGRTQQCSFQIRVKAAAPTPPPAHAEISYPDLDLSAAPAALTQSSHSSLFAGHESFVVCPGKEPVKVTSSQFVDLPVGCTLKNVRPQTSGKTHLKRGILTSLRRRYNHF
ncbi:uncharacterized protein Dmoj_GI13136 [Drosophila mojavensis]|uniref:Fibrillin-1 n=1 Tax=Drosophila mojavensis TaxID=7230 RepID=B4KUM9_DROMO|nr:uncharacterized protein Dmoj_GI13136 [Drosophila mojavensis]